MVEELITTETDIYLFFRNHVEIETQVNAHVTLVKGVYINRTNKLIKKAEVYEMPSIRGERMGDLWSHKDRVPQERGKLIQ